MQCPCNPSATFSECCSQLIKGERNAVSAEELMRSRYSAYAVGAIDYLLQTTYPANRKYYSRRSVRQWAEANQWKRLDIHSVTRNTVTFTAHYISKAGTRGMHREHSTFCYENDQWYFLEGETP